MELTIGAMIDALVTTNIKIFMLEDIKREPTANDKQIADATKKTNTLNVQRNSLMDGIDQAMNKLAQGEQQKLFGSNKMYGK